MQLDTMDLADLTRRILAMHDDWDTPHSFYAITWDGTEPRIHTAAMIDPAIHPNMHPGLMVSIATDAIAADKGAPVVAFAFQFEAFSVMRPDDNAPAGEVERFEADRAQRRFHLRPDRVEQAMVLCADVTGRLWSATKTRGQDDEVRESFRPSKDADADGVMTGQFVSALDACAAAAAVALELATP